MRLFAKLSDAWLRLCCVGGRLGLCLEFQFLSACSCSLLAGRNRSKEEQQVQGSLLVGDEADVTLFQAPNRRC